MLVPSRNPVRRRMALRCMRRSRFSEVLGDMPTMDCPAAHSFASCGGSCPSVGEAQACHILISFLQQVYYCLADDAYLLLLYNMGRYKVDIQVLVALRGEKIGAARHHWNVDGH